MGYYCRLHSCRECDGCGECMEERPFDGEMYEEDEEAIMQIEGGYHI